MRYTEFRKLCLDNVNKKPSKVTMSLIHRFWSKNKNNRTLLIMYGAILVGTLQSLDLL